VADHNTSLGYIRFLREKWKRDVGYSSHDENWENNLIALLLGATVIERHITEEKKAEGLDHSSSSNFDEFARLCHYANEIDSITSGNAPRIPNQGELLNKQNLGRSFYALRDFKVGEFLVMRDFEYRNPQIGIGISDLEMYLDKKIVIKLDKGEVLTHQHFLESRTQVNKNAFEESRRNSVSIPVRLADYRAIREVLPIGAYEFHLSYKEVASDLLTYPFDAKDRFSVHLPDYIDSTTLIDPFSPDIRIKESSRECIRKVIAFSEKLARESCYSVPIVASLAGIGIERESFYPQVSQLFSEFDSELAPLTLQWLPPYAWYFGGSIKLSNVNDIEDINWINELNLPITLDTSHLLLGQAAFGFDPQDVIRRLSKNIIHWHISDASGLDGEGLPIGEGGIENEQLISGVIDQVGIKVIEVWQGHFYNYEGFKVAINKIAELKGRKK
jgi:sugar phosphate isomerase/epimerase